MKKWIVDGKFVELKTDELKELSTEELAVYTADKNADGLNTLKAEIEKNQKDYIKDVVTKDEFADKMTTIQNSLKELLRTSSAKSSCIKNIQYILNNVSNISMEGKKNDYQQEIYTRIFNILSNGINWCILCL